MASKPKDEGSKGTFDAIGTVRNFAEKVAQTYILSCKGESYTQQRLLMLFRKYWNSEFLNGDETKEGYNYFFNVLKFPVHTAAKQADIDTKDIRFIAEPGQSYLPVWALNKEMGGWMEDTDFGVTLNDMTDLVPRNGNFVLKKADDAWHRVELENFTNDPWAKTLKDSYIVIENNPMNPAELLKMKGTWIKAAVNKAASQFLKQGDKSYIDIAEIRMWGPRSFWDDGKTKGDKGKEIKRGLLVVANLFDVKKNTKNNKIEDNSITLFKKQTEAWPYREFFWQGYDGTWLRHGIVWDLLEDQFRANYSTNIFQKGLAWTSKKIYQSKDQGLKRNLLSEVDNGEIMRVTDEITPVVNEERNLAPFTEEMVMWDKNRREKTMNFPAIAGENMPSATPFRLGFVLQQAAGGFYDKKRESIALDLKKFIKEEVVPDFQKSRRTEHLFNQIGEDDELQSIEKLLVEYILFESIKKRIKSGGRVPTQEEVDRERKIAIEKIRSRSERALKAPEGYYASLKYKVKLIITDENAAIDTQVQTMTTLLQTIATNPKILDDPTTRSIIFSIIDKTGVSPEEIKRGKGSENLLDQLPPEVTRRFSPPPGGQAPDLGNVTTNKTL